MLSGPDIVNRIIEGRVQPDLLSHGLKHRLKVNSSSEQQQISRYQENLRRLLSAKHISRISERSTADLLANGDISLRKRCGKWQSTCKGGTINPYQALYLHATNQLAIYQNEVIVSIEKAYCILLSNSWESTHTHEGAFQIFSHLRKNAYKIVTDSIEGSGHSLAGRMTETHVWSYLSDLLQHTNPVSASDPDASTVRSSMDRTIETIKNPSGDKMTRSSVKVSDESNRPAGAMSRRQNIRSIRRFNDFMVLNMLYRDVFSQIDIIAPINCEDTVTAGQLIPTFNAYLDNTVKSKIIYPSGLYRIVILRENRAPSIKRAFEIYKGKLPGSNVIFMFVTSEKSFYSFVYRF